MVCLCLCLTRTHACTHARTHTHTHTRTRAHTHTHTRSSNHTQRHTQTDTHTHTHTHTHKHARGACARAYTANNIRLDSENHISESLRNNLQVFPMSVSVSVACGVTESERDVCFLSAWQNGISPLVPLTLSPPPFPSFD